MAELYNVDRSRITRHINNIINDNELDFNSNVRKTHFPNSDKPVYIYNLDMILAVGYRVNSKRGIMFRRWANSILKQYLLKGFSINEKRCMAHNDSLIDLNNRVTYLEEKFKSIDSIELAKDKVFYSNEYYEGYCYIKKLFHKAKDKIVIIDSYLDYSVLEMMNEINVDITIYISSSSPINNKEISLFQINHKLNVIRTNKYHDRFIIIDNDLYNVGSSIKDIGKKISHISKLEAIDIDNLLNKYKKEA